MHIVMIGVEKLRPAAYNPRIIGADTLAKLEKGIAEFGFVEPIVINADMTVIGGHQRLKAAMNLGMAEVPCMFVDLDKTKEKALNLALNRLHGEWEHGMLAAMLKEMEAIPDFDIELTGFDAAEMAGMANFSGIDFNNAGAPSAFNSDLIDIRGGADKSGSGTNQKWLSFEGKRIPLTDVEAEALAAPYDKYTKEFGSLYGFATYLMGRHDA